MGTVDMVAGEFCRSWWLGGKEGKREVDGEMGGCM